jgi:hypothetical protein
MAAAGGIVAADASLRGRRREAGRHQVSAAVVDMKQRNPTWLCQERAGSAMLHQK